MRTKEEIKKRLFVLMIMYRKVIRKKMLKIVILFNGILFLFALRDNLPSMILFLLNMFYIYNYLKKEYTEVNLKGKDRYKDMTK